MRLLWPQIAPWGWGVTILDIRILWIKILYVRPRQATSLQKHRHRRELHIRLDRKPGKRIRYFPKRARHRLSHGIYLELAWGRCYERDIIRLSDLYNRTS